MDNQLVEEIVRRVMDRLEVQQSAEPPVHISQEQSEKDFVDLTSPEEKAKILIEDPRLPKEMEYMKKETVARIGAGKAGARLKTKTYLTLKADHALARDAVMTKVSDKLLEKLKLFSVNTKCKNQDEFLTRPDLGRQFDDNTCGLIKEKCIHSPQVQILVADGLSSSAIEANVENFLPVLLDGLKQKNIKTGTTFFIKYGRVPSMDVISEILDAEVTCILIGERPGLATSDSMSAYIAYSAKVGMPEARRTVVSNIHAGGIAAVEAGAYVADVIEKILKAKTSGVDLKL